jgi:hypothetical protein
VLFRRDRARLAIRLSLAGCLFVLGLAVALACDSHMNDRLTTTVTTNGSTTTIVTGP